MKEISVDSAITAVLSVLSLKAKQLTIATFARASSVADHSQDALKE